MSHVAFALDLDSHDMYKKMSGIALVYDSDAILQTVKTRLLTHRGEWFLDLSAGLPYFTEILTHNPNYPAIEGILAREIINTDGVRDLKNIGLSSDLNKRVLFVDFSYTDVYNQSVVGGVRL